MDFVTAGIDDLGKVSVDDRRKRMCSHGTACPPWRASPCRWQHNRCASTQRGGYNQYTYSAATAPLRAT